MLCSEVMRKRFRAGERSSESERGGVGRFGDVERSDIY